MKTSVLKQVFKESQNRKQRPQYVLLTLNLGLLIAYLVL